MQSGQFREFLLHTFQSPRGRGTLGAKATMDAVSRCRRVECLLGEDIDSVLRSGGDVDALVGRTRTITSISGQAATSMARAICLYANFTRI